jgi:hypothetical protein
MINMGDDREISGGFKQRGSARSAEKINEL